MSGRRELFTVDDAPTLAVRLASAALRIVDGEQGRVTVVVVGRDADRFTVEQVGDRIVVEQPSGALRWGSYEITVTAPPGLAVHAKLASADVEATLRLRELRADAASGDVHAQDVTGGVRVKSASGDVRLCDVGGDLEVTTASGDVRVGSVNGRAEVNTASGDVSFTAACSSLGARSASGDIVISRFEGMDVRAQSMSGDVRMSFPPGKTLDVDLSTMSGDVRNTFGLADAPYGAAAGGHVRVYARTVSGDITIGPATG